MFGIFLLSRRLFYALALRKVMELIWGSRKSVHTYRQIQSGWKWRAAIDFWCFPREFEHVPRICWSDYWRVAGVPCSRTRLIIVLYRQESHTWLTLGRFCCAIRWNFGKSGSGFIPVAVVDDDFINIMVTVRCCLPIWNQYGKVAEGGINCAPWKNYNLRRSPAYRNSYRSAATTVTMIECRCDYCLNKSYRLNGVPLIR